jgi:hypothetical protein
MLSPMSSMPRILLVVIAILAGSAQALASMHPPSAIECAGDCPEDGGDAGHEGDEHAKGCFSHCSCTSHAPRQLPTARSLAAPPPPTAGCYQAATADAPEAPDPNRILHVPKR